MSAAGQNPRRGIKVDPGTKEAFQAALEGMPPSVRQEAESFRGAWNAGPVVLLMTLANGAPQVEIARGLRVRGKLTDAIVLGPGANPLHILLGAKALVEDRKRVESPSSVRRVTIEEELDLRHGGQALEAIRAPSSQQEEEVEGLGRVVILSDEFPAGPK